MKPNDLGKLTDSGLRRLGKTAKYGPGCFGKTDKIRSGVPGDRKNRKNIFHNIFFADLVEELVAGFVIYYAVRFGESELLVEIKERGDTLAVTADRVVAAAHEHYTHITLNTLDP